MPTSVRLDQRTESILRKIARRTGRTRSEIIRRAILRFAEETEPAPTGTLYDRVKDLIGVVKGGPPDLGSRSEEYLREMFARRRTSK